MNFYGMKLTVRHPEGSVRHGKLSDGRMWSQRMPYAYASIDDSLGVDGKPVDAILGPHLSYSKVYVCTLPKQYGGEDKVLIGFLSSNEARNAFISCYASNVEFLAGMSKMNAYQLRKRLKKRRGLNIEATLFEGQNYALTQIEFADQSSKYDDRNDKTATPEYGAEMSRRTFGQPQTPTTSQGGDTAVMNNNFYSSKEKDK